MNFNLVESNDSYLDNIYESFKKDFLNPYITVKELKKEYDLSTRKYNILREKVLIETKIPMKPHINKKHEIKVIGNKYIVFNNHGRCSVCKNINGVKKTFGTYKNLTTAKKVRDKLIENDWDPIIAERLKKVYGAGKYKPSVEKLDDIYSEFEELFFEGVLMKDIIKKLDINQYQYNLMSRFIRRKYGLTSKKNSNILKNTI